MALFFIEEISTIFEKVNAISCKYYYHSWIHITDCLCSLLLGFTEIMFYSTKVQNSIIQLLFCIPGMSAEPKVNFRAKIIVVIKIGLLLEIDWYYYD